MKKTNLPIIHFSFLFLLILSFCFGMGAIMLSYFACLVIHEMVHGMVAKRRGYKIGRIKLLATGAVLEAESDEFGFSDEVVIALSGPLFNLCFALLIIASWWVFPELFNWTQDLCVINLAIFAFNMLPVFPLDGGRIFLALLSKRLERKEAVRIAKTVAISISCLIFLLFIFSLFSSPNLSLGVVGITLFVGSVSEDKSAAYKRIFYPARKAARAKKGSLELRTLVVSSREHEKLFRLLDARHYTLFLVVDEGLNIVDKIEERDLYEDAVYSLEKK